MSEVSRESGSITDQVLGRFVVHDGAVFRNVDKVRPDDQHKFDETSPGQHLAIP